MLLNLLFVQIKFMFEFCLPSLSIVHRKLKFVFGINFVSKKLLLLLLLLLKRVKNKWKINISIKI